MGQMVGASSNCLLLFYEKSGASKPRRLTFGDGIAFCSIFTAKADSNVASKARVISFPRPPWPDPAAGGSSQTNIVIHIWTRGTVDTAALIERIGAGVHQSLHEYCLDVACISNVNIEREHDVDLRDVVHAHSSALSLSAPSVCHTTVKGLFWSGISVVKSSLPSFVFEMYRILQKIVTPVSVRICIEKNDGKFQALEPSMFVDLTRMPATLREVLLDIPFSKSVVLIAGAAKTDRGIEQPDTFYPPTHLHGGFCRSSTATVVIVKGKCSFSTYNWNEQRVQFLRSRIGNVIDLVARRSRLLLDILVTKMGLTPLQSYIQSPPRAGQMWTVSLDDDEASVLSECDDVKKLEVAHASTTSFENIACLQFKNCDYTVAATATSLQQINGLEKVMPWERFAVRDTAKIIMSSHSLHFLKSYVNTQVTSARAVPVANEVGKELSQLLASSQATMIEWFVNMDDAPRRWYSSLVEPSDYRFLLQRANLDPIQVYVPRGSGSSLPSPSTNSTIKSAQVESSSLNRTTKPTPSRSRTSSEDARRANASRRSRAALLAQSKPRNRRLPDPSSGSSESGPGLSRSNRTLDGGLQRSNRAIDGSDNSPGRTDQIILPRSNRSASFDTNRQRALPGSKSDEAGDYSGGAVSAASIGHEGTDIETTSIILKDPFFRWQLGSCAVVQTQAVAGKHGAQQDNLQIHAAHVLAAADAASSTLQRHLHQSYLLQQLQAIRYESFGAVQSAVDTEELEFNITNAARLLHACRWPLLFNKNRRMLEESAAWQPPCNSFDRTNHALLSGEQFFYKLPCVTN